MDGASRWMAGVSAVLCVLGCALVGLLDEYAPGALVCPAGVSLVVPLGIVVVLAVRRGSGR